jgi:membrane-associated phospholipid phosphatase
MDKTKNYGNIIIACVLVCLTICGSFFDYEIASFLYVGQQPAENLFGIIFAFIGIIPTFVGWSFLGASIFYLAKKQVVGQTKRRWLIALSILLFILSFFFFCNTLMMVNSNAFPIHWAIAYPVGISIIIGAAFLGYKLSKISANPKLLKSILFLTCVSLVVMAIVMATKGIMNRPRYRFVLENANPEYFRNWWQSGKDIKESLATKTVTDEFSSFPSGHSAYSMFAIFLFPAFAEYLPKLNKYKPLLFVGGIIWWALTALSRLTVGAHYLTDVSIAAFVTVICYEVVKIIWRLIENRKKLNKEKKE